MSPLAHSLLALAALLVAADAQRNCDEETYGDTTGDSIKLKTIYIPPKGGRVTIPDGCPSNYGPDYEAVGETITACNNDANGAAPEIEQVNPPDLTPMDVVCAVDGCPSGAKADIVQYCAPN